MNDDEGFANGVANEAKEQLLRTNQHYNRLLVSVVMLFSIIGFILIVTIVVGTARLQEYAKINRHLGEQNARLLEDRTHADAFGRMAVQCVLDQFALHRNTNQVVHDHMARALHVDSTPVTPLPPLPTDQQVMDDCSPFYRR